MITRTYVQKGLPHESCACGYMWYYYSFTSDTPFAMTRTYVQKGVPYESSAHGYVWCCYLFTSEISNKIVL